MGWGLNKRRLPETIKWSDSLVQTHPLAWGNTDYGTGITTIELTE
jgi:hypothetical protein